MWCIVNTSHSSSSSISVTWPIGTKLCRNVHRMVLCKDYVFLFCKSEIHHRNKRSQGVKWYFLFLYVNCFLFKHCLAHLTQLKLLPSLCVHRPALHFYLLIIYWGNIYETWQEWSLYSCHSKLCLIDLNSKRWATWLKNRKFLNGPKQLIGNQTCLIFSLWLFNIYSRYFCKVYMASSERQKKLYQFSHCELYIYIYM